MKQNFYLKISLSIIGIALIIGLIIVNYSDKSKNTKEALADQNNKGDYILQSFNLQKTNKKLGANLEDLEISEEENLTEKVMSELSQQIIQLNKNNDLSSGYLEVPNEELFSEEMIEKYKDYFLKNLSLITISDLTFDKEEPPYTSIKYFYDILQIIYDKKITNDIVDKTLDGFIDSEDPEYLKDIIIKFNEAIESFKKVPIPSSFADLHLELINLMIEKKVVLTAMYNYQKDSISAMAAIELFEELDNQYEEWLSNLITKMKNDGVQFSY